MDQDIRLLKQIQKLVVRNSTEDPAIRNIFGQVSQSSRTVSGNQEFSVWRIEMPPSFEEMMNTLSAAATTQEKNTKGARPAVTDAWLKVLRIDT